MAEPEPKVHDVFVAPFVLSVDVYHFVGPGFAALTNSLSKLVRIYPLLSLRFHLNSFSLAVVRSFHSNSGSGCMLKLPETPMR
jgi:hypothetical protein